MTFAARARLLFMQKFDAERILEAMARATVLMGVPTFYVRLLQSPRLNAAATAGMRLFVAGSAPLLAETHRAWKERTSHEILERYGMTGTCMIASNPYDSPCIEGSVGRPLPGVDVRIADPDTSAELDADEVGMIEVSGPNVFAGYWNMPDKTAAEFRSDDSIRGESQRAVELQGPFEILNSKGYESHLRLHSCYLPFTIYKLPI